MTTRLLLDQNLSSRLLIDLEQDFPGSKHVRIVELDRASDRDIWDFAALNGFAILSKDADFHHLSVLLGPPPKVVWLRAGNCSTNDIVLMLRSNVQLIKNFCGEDESAFLVLD